MADAGWYPDAHDPDSQHYFDGTNWTGHRRPNPVSAPAAEETVRRGDLGAHEGYGAQPTQSWAPPHDQHAGAHEQQYGWQTGAHEQQYGAPGQQGGAPGQQYGAHQQQYGQQYGQSFAPAARGGAPTPRKRRTPLIAGGVVAALLVAGGVTYLVWPEDDAPSITFQGKEIANAAETLKQGESAVARAVDARRGAKNTDTRCYFAKPKKAESGAKSSDIDDALRCGPVLFVDGQRSAAYLEVPLSDSSEGSKVALTPRTDLGTADPVALDDAMDLVRPDGETHPTAHGGAGSLDVPSPQRAAANVLTTGPLSSGDQAKTVGLKVTGRSLSVTLTELARITRYGTGDDARSAPQGQQLIAFKLRYGAGDLTFSTATRPVLQAGGQSRPVPLPTGSDYVIAAIPTSGATLALTDGGITQTIALPGGTAGPNNVALFSRTTRRVELNKSFSTPVRLRQGSRSANTSLRTVARFARLDFWTLGTTRPSSPKQAFLTVGLQFTVKGSSTVYAFSPDQLRLKVGGTTYRARDILPGSKILDAFVVPAGFTSGTLEITGTSKAGRLTTTVTKTRTVSISIPR